MLSLVRVISGAEQLTSSGTLAITLTAAMPIALAALGGLWSERAGVVNIGLEGMMIMGTLGAGYFGYNYGVLAGVLGATALGMLGGALHALATVIVGVDHIVSGVAINIIALGVAGFLAEAWFSGLEGGGPTQSPPLPTPWSINISFISEPANALESKHWFLLSDLASVVEMLTRNLSSLVILGILLIIGSYWALWRTRFGLRLRSCGEAPAAAESLGVNVYRYKIIAVVISGGLAGLGGAVLAMVLSSGFQVGQTNGRGYIGLAAMIFGNWRPTGLFMGSTLFGYTQALPFREGTVSVHALLLFIAALLLAVGDLPDGAAGSVPGDRRLRLRGDLPGLVPLHRHRSAPVHHHGAVRHDAAGPRACLATVAHARGRRADLPQGLGGMSASAEFDWDALKARAVEAATHAYAPYSSFPVGAAARVEDGRVVVGCNVENAAYGVALCAECGMVSQLHITGGGRLTHAVCVNGRSEVIMPCGRCRQLLMENGGPELLVMTVTGVRRMDEVLPDAFGPHDLD